MNLIRSIALLATLAVGASATDVDGTWKVHFTGPIGHRPKMVTEMIFDFKVEGSEIARSGDLGYTYGLAERFVSASAAAADTSVYLHIWRQDDGRTWKLAMAVLNPLR